MCESFLFTSVLKTWHRREVQAQESPNSPDSIGLYHNETLTLNHRWHQSPQMLHNRSQSDKRGCQTNFLKRGSNMYRWRYWVKITIGRTALGREGGLMELRDISKWVRQAEKGLEDKVCLAARDWPCQWVMREPLEVPPSHNYKAWG